MSESTIDPTAAEADFLEVGRSLQAFEAMTDEALGRGGALLETLTRKRLALGISGPTAQPIIAKVVASLSSMVEAREHGSLGHLKLRDLRDRYRRDPKSEGDCCGNPRFTGQADASDKVRAIR